MKTKERLQIKLNEKYQITADSHQYILQQIGIKDGKEWTRNIAYAGTIRHLIKSVYEREIKSSSAKELIELEKMMDNLSEEISSTINELV